MFGLSESQPIGFLSEPHQIPCVLCQAPVSYKSNPGFLPAFPGESNMRPMGPPAFQLQEKVLSTRH